MIQVSCMPLGALMARCSRLHFEIDSARCAAKEERASKSHCMSVTGAMAFFFSMCVTIIPSMGPFSVNPRRRGLH